MDIVIAVSDGAGVGIAVGDGGVRLVELEVGVLKLLELETVEVEEASMLELSVWVVIEVYGVRTMGCWDIQALRVDSRSSGMLNSP